MILLAFVLEFVLIVRNVKCEQLTRFCTILNQIQTFYKFS